MWWSSGPALQASLRKRPSYTLLKALAGGVSLEMPPAALLETLMNDHPNHVLAIWPVRLIDDEAGPDGPIVGLGTFSVERSSDDEARFQSTHVLFDQDADWRAPGAHVQCLLHPHTLAIGCGPPGHNRHRLDRPRPPASYAELPGTAHLPSLQRRVIRARERQVASLGREYGLMVSDYRLDLQQAQREAADRAKAVWILFLGFVRDPEQRSQLIAAWQAWSALRRASIPL